MNRPANYYAARTAAIKEALEEERARVAASRKAPQKVPAPYSAEALRSCGERVSVTLGVFFGDQSGTIVEATRCYSLTDWLYLATFSDEAGHFHVVQVAAYDKRGDIYNYAISEVAVV